MVDDRFLCTDNRMKSGVCHGDLGSPMVANNTLIGIVSWNVECARGYPDVYTNVYQCLDFIQSQIQ